MACFKHRLEGFATEFYHIRRPLVPLGDGFEQQFEMVARPRNHFCYNSLTVPV